jgi:predicted esterase
MSALLLAGLVGVGLMLSGGGASSSGSSSDPLSGGGGSGGLEDDDEYDPGQPDNNNGDDDNVDEPIQVNCDGIGVQGGTTDGLTYTEILTGGATANETLPMVIALHGLGQTKEYLVNKLNGLNLRARVIIPDAFYDRTGDLPGRKWWKGYHPQGLQAHMTEVIPEASEKLAPFVARLPRCRPTIGLPVLAGHSQGGYIVLDFAAAYPQLVSGIVSSASWRPVALWDDVPVAPVIAVHGKNDTGVDYDRSLEYYEEMIARGAPLEHRATNGSHSLGTSNLNAWKQAIIDTLESAGYAGAQRQLRRPARRFASAGRFRGGRR